MWAGYGGVVTHNIRGPTEFCDGSSDAQLARALDQLRPGVDTELRVDARELCFHSARAHKEVRGDVRCRRAAGSHRRNLSFAPTERCYPESTAAPCALTATEEEDLDLRQDGLGVVQPQAMIRSGKLDIPCAGDVFGKVTT